MSPTTPRKYLRDLLGGIEGNLGVVDGQAATAFAIGKDVAPGPFKAIVTALETVYTRCKGMKHYRKQSQHLFDFCRTIVCAVDANIMDGLDLDGKTPHIENLHQLLIAICQQLELINAYTPLKAFTEHENIKETFMQFRVALTQGFEVFGISSLLQLQRFSENFAAAATEDLHQIQNIVQEIGANVQEIGANVQELRVEVSQMHTTLIQVLVPPVTAEEALRRQQTRARVERDGSASQQSSFVALREMESRAGDPPLPLGDLANEAQRVGDSPVSQDPNATLWRGIWLGDQTVHLALKYPRAQIYLKPKDITRFHRSVEILRRLKHRNIIELKGVKYGKPGSDDTTPIEFIAFRWVEKGDILSYVAKVPDADRLKLMFHVACGLKYLHAQSPPVVHRGIEPANILVDAEEVAIISDFGVAKALDEFTVSTNPLVTGNYTISNGEQKSLRWMAPEVSDGQYDQPADVYSWAMTTLHVFSEVEPFAGTKQPGRVVIDVSKGLRPKPKNHPSPWLTDAMWKLLERCWAQEPAERLTMVDVVNEIAAMRPDLCDS